MDTCPEGRAPILCVAVAVFFFNTLHVEWSDVSWYGQTLLHPSSQCTTCRSLHSFLVFDACSGGATFFFPGTPVLIWTSLVQRHQLEQLCCADRSPLERLTAMRRSAEHGRRTVPHLGGRPTDCALEFGGFPLVNLDIRQFAQGPHWKGLDPVCSCARDLDKFLPSTMAATLADQFHLQVFERTMLPHLGKAVPA